MRGHVWVGGASPPRALRGPVVFRFGPGRRALAPLLQPMATRAPRGTRNGGPQWNHCACWGLDRFGAGRHPRLAFPCTTTAIVANISYSSCASAYTHRDPLPRLVLGHMGLLAASFAPLAQKASSLHVCWAAAGPADNLETCFGGMWLVGPGLQGCRWQSRVATRPEAPSGVCVCDS